MTLTDWVETIESNLKGLKFFSLGACPGCDTCDLPAEPTDEEYDAASESHFSWSSCDSCNSGLGGDRHAAHAYLTDHKTGEARELLHLSVCVDCLLFHANGDTPDNLEDQ